jgi:hypothetical protein
MTNNPTPYDPRPEWMQRFHKETAGGADRFKQWAANNLNINIDDQLKYDQSTGKSGIAQMVLTALEKQIPFILNNGPERFCVIIPKIQIIAVYGRGGNTTEALTAKQFQNQVKMLYVIYPQFSPASLPLVKAALELSIVQRKFKDNPQIK